MKLSNITARPSFELVFAFSIAAIFIIPSVVMAQTQKNTEIIISNGDTVINGKNIKTLSPAERAQALTDMARLKGDRTKRRQVVIERRFDGQPPMIANDGMTHQYGDYVGGNPVQRPMHLKIMKDTARVMAYQFKMDDNGSFTETPDHDGERAHVEFFRHGDNGMTRLRSTKFNRRNSQRFSYSNTDGSGVSTNINYSVTEPAADESKADEKNLLPVTDIKLVPDFTTGKTTLSFNLPVKAATEVEWVNSDGKVLWNEKLTGESFSRSFPLPLNGMYKLKVKQGGKSVVKNVLKEE